MSTPRGTRTCVGAPDGAHSSQKPQYRRKGRCHRGLYGTRRGGTSALRDPPPRGSAAAASRRHLAAAGPCRYRRRCGYRGRYRGGAGRRRTQPCRSAPFSEAKCSRTTSSRVSGAGWWRGTRVGTADSGALSPARCRLSETGGCPRWLKSNARGSPVVADVAAGRLGARGDPRC